jgi:RecB family exonuclease
MVERYLDHLMDNRLSVQACERFVQSARMRVNDGLRVTLSGKIDVVLEGEDGTIFIEDYKTGLLPTRDAFERFLSTTIYQLLGRVLYPEATRIVVGLLQPAIGMHMSTILTSDLVATARQEIKTMAMAIASYPPASDEHFPAMPGEYCSWCPARESYCPVYRNVACQEEDF